MENRWNVDEPVGDVDMKELLLVIWRKAWLVVIAAVLCAGLAFGGTKMLVKPVYQSSVLFYVNRIFLNFWSQLGKSTKGRC